MNPALRSLVLTPSVAAALFLGAPAEAQVASALIREGDDVTGMGDVVTNILGTTANGTGGYAVRTISVTGDRIWGDHLGGLGTVLASETNGLFGLNVTSLEANFGLSNAGVLSYGPNGTDIASGTTGVDVIWTRDTVGLTDVEIAAEGDPVLTLANRVFRFCSNMKITENGTPYFRAGIDDTAGVDMGTGLVVGAGHTVLVKTGDPAPAPLPMGTLADVNAASADARFSALGTHWINELDTNLPGTMDGWITVDGAIAMTGTGTLIGEGEAIPAASGGMPGENWAFFDVMDINENGDFFFTGDTGLADTTRDEIIALNGNILWREGDVIDGEMVSGTLTNTWADMNEDTDIAFAWNTAGGTLETLFLNGEIILRDGDAVDFDGDGTVEATSILVDLTDTGSLALSNRIGGDVHLFFSADVDVNGSLLEGFFRMVVPVVDVFTSFCNGDGGDQMGCTPCPCGNTAIAGTLGGCLNSAGNSGRLLPTGSPSVASDTMRFEVSGANVNTFGVLASADNALPQAGACPPGSGIASALLDGLRCVGGGLLRHGSRPTDSNGDIGVTTNGWGPPNGPVGGLIASSGFVAGQTRNFQCFYREIGTLICLTGQNTTNAVAVTMLP